MEQNDTNQRKKLKKQLKGKYRQEYKKISRLLEQDLSSDREFQEIDFGVLTLFLNAQNEHQDPLEAMGGSLEGFYLSLLEESESYSVKKRVTTDRTDGFISICAIVLLLVSVTLVRLYYTDTYQLQKNGFVYLERNGAVVQNSLVLDEAVTFELDVNNLSSNIGKTIYEKDDCSIVLSNVREVNGNILLDFKSVGVTENGGGRLISALKHLFDENGASYFVMNASCSFKMGETIYACSAADMSGLTKTGDEFSFELFSAADFENGEFKELDNFYMQEKVEVILDGLVKTVWE